MITKEDFDNLDFREALTCTWDNGDFVSNREYYNQTLALYAMKGFFVEVYYENESNEITKVESVTAEDKVLSLYLPNIELKGLLG